MSHIFRARITASYIGAGIIGGALLPPLAMLPLAAEAKFSAHGDSQAHRNVGNIQDTGGPDGPGLSTMADGPMAIAHGIDPRFNFTAWRDESDPFTAG